MYAVNIKLYPSLLFCSATVQPLPLILDHIAITHIYIPITYIFKCDRICEKGSSTHIQFSDFEGP